MKQQQPVKAISSGDFVLRGRNAEGLALLLELLLGKQKSLPCGLPASPRACWSVLTTGSFGTNAVVHTDSTATNAAMRFYRVGSP